MNITDFLLARIAEDEARFHAHVRSEREEYGPDLSPEHVAELDKALARVLAECEAKRRIVESYQWYVDTVDRPNANTLYGEHLLAERHAKVLAAVYSDHPDYRDEWRP